MALFQKSVIKNYLKLQNADSVQKAYKKYIKYFHNTVIQENIKGSKEEQFQAKFLDELFVNILGYTINPKPDYNLTTEFKNQKNNRKADGALLANGKAIGVIELKGTNTKDLESIRKQAFDYKANQKDCVYVVTSNFEKLRFYINDATEFLEFNLFLVSEEEFALLYLCLQKDNMLSNLPLKIKEESIIQEEQITKKFYADYSLFKRELFRDLVKQNVKRIKYDSVIAREAKQSHEPSSNLDDIELKQLEKNVKLALFKKSQKLIDRFLFIFFAEDRSLLPANSTAQILNKWKADIDFGDNRPLYDLFKQYFNYLDSGRKGTTSRAEIYAYNGGLFKPDSILDNLVIDDQLLYKHTLKLATYDFESQVDVNILGHIFENSLNEIESVNAEIEGAEFDKQKSKRKKDGVFYTPKYITKYIVENTVGKLCEEKKLELGFQEEEYFKSRVNRPKKKLQELVELLDAYRTWLLQLTICDPACGSGAFLNQALDFLIKEHRYIDELKSNVLGGGLVFSDIENTILENNIYGVDLNEESVEIAKLSLWLRTAQPRRKLNDLNSNIKCGNSLIDDKKVAGDKAFNWQQQFPQIFQQKEKKAFHITTAIHDSRTSDRMLKYKVREKRAMGTNPYANVIYFTEQDDLLITQTIAEIVKEDKLKVLAYNICADHIHLLLVCDEADIPKIMQKVKGRSSRYRDKGLKPLVAPAAPAADAHHKPLWAQKYYAKPVTTETHLHAAIDYIEHNRTKHELPAHSREIHNLIDAMCCSYQEAFKEDNGGFDVVIGNPPYVRVQSLKENYLEQTSWYENRYSSATNKYDLYALFTERAVELINEKGYVSFILPHKFLVADFGIGIRGYLAKNKLVSEIIHFGSSIVFNDASTYTCILTINKRIKEKLNFIYVNPFGISNPFELEQLSYKNLNSDKWTLLNKIESNLLSKINAYPKLQDLTIGIFQGIITTGDDIFMLEGEFDGDVFKGYSKELNSEVKLESRILKKVLKGQDIKRYLPLNSDKYVIYPHLLIDGKTVPIEPSVFETEYPLTYSYLKNFEKELYKKKVRYKTNPKYWYSLHRSRDIELFDKDFVITPQLQNHPSFTVKETAVYPDAGGYLILPKDDISSKPLLAILNSKILWYYIKNTSSEYAGGYFYFKTKYLENFGIANFQNKAVIIRLVDKQLLENKNFQTLIQKFQLTLQRKFETLDKLSKKLENWYELSYTEFIKELGKKKIKLSLSEEAEWEDYFIAEQQKAVALKAQIDLTDREIDAMVYELYGLTEEEIKIVEQS